MIRVNGRLILLVVAAICSPFLVVSFPAGNHHMAIPAFVWSNKNIFKTGNNLYGGIEKGLTQESLVNMIHSKKFELPDLSEDFNSVEKVLIFLTDKLSATEVSKISNAYGDSSSSFVRSAVLKSSSSAVLPYVLSNLPPGVQNPWSVIFSKYHGSVLRLEDLENDDAIEEVLLAGNFIFVLVGEDFSKEADAAVKIVCKKASEVLGDNYVAVLSGLSPVPVPRKEQLIQVRELQTDTNSTNSTAIRNNPHLLSSMLVSLLLILTTGVYICCLDCVETPTSFAARYPYKGKEFN
mmetsp:Transcript_15485/g.17514  ORF Transcript_15485/g.17514 Transcript_15485/m.17514 type:complete len:293 (+) Transcript_15485:248-1126(+)|eukprot:CAMPEP_0184065090 /NCGR_PEP_ID=MMETSP0957-20130417/2475_1 /TAXON_ID=627963 /ORGANISM="Aplanochytrium sp, Strain PBS07" /LENGTH=292 /DNA_ID=CAMNT_0026362697 /DNA_START=132 /DNA_END=1010 /DNA_ORIENTATION=-